MKSKLIAKLSGSLTVGLALAATLGGTAYAHHSATSFDMANPATLSGVVKDFRWGNPHTWIDMLVPNGAGGTDEWSLESNAVNVLVRQGWTKESLKPGQKVTLLIAPQKDGGHGGRVMSVLEVDGQPFHTSGPSQP